MRNTALRGSLVATLGICTCLIGTSRPSWAGEVTLSVLGLEPAAGAPEAVATAVTEALRQRVTSTSGYRLVPGRDLVEVKLVFSCPDEAPPCMTQAAQSIGAQKVVFGNLQPVGMDAYLVTLKLLDADRGVVDGWSSEQISKAQATPVALRGPAQKWFAALTGQAAPGSIKVTGGVVGASVWLDGVQSGLLGADGLTLAGVAAGGHEVVVSKAGYEKFDRKVTVTAGATEKVNVDLKSIERPGEATTEPAPVAPVDSVSRLTKPELVPASAAPNQGARIAAWALLGVGMLGVGFGGYSSYQVGVVNSNLDPYRRFPCATGTSQNCTADGKQQLDPLTKEQADYVARQKSSGESWSKWQWAGYGAGGVFLVTSAVFFYHGYFAGPSSSASSSKRGNLIVMPSFGPGNAGAVARMAF